jgi:hypothetical protein
MVQHWLTPPPSPSLTHTKIYGGFADTKEKKRVVRRLSQGGGGAAATENANAPMLVLADGREGVQSYGDKFAGKDTADHFTGGAFVIDTTKEGTQSVDRGDMMLADGKVGAVPRYGKGHEGKDTEDSFLEGGARSSFCERRNNCCCSRI